MASKRLLKKSINNLTYDLVSECFTYRHFHPESNTGVNTIIHEIVITRNELIKKVNHAPSIGTGSNSYFKEIHQEMKTMVNHLDKIESLKK